MNSAFTTHIQEDGLLYLTASSLSVPSLAHGFSTDVYKRQMWMWLLARK